MTSDDEKELQELLSKYPDGSVERKVLQYSMGSHDQAAVPEILVTAFKVLMGITVIMSIFSLVAFLSH